MNAKNMNLDEGRRASIKVELLIPHPEIQRPFKQAHADRIAAHFDPYAFGELSTCPVGNKSDKYYVLNGQHRLAAVVSLFGRDQEVPCRIFENETKAALARHCLKENNAKAWTALGAWAIRVIAREQSVLEIEAILHRYELHVDSSAREGAVRAVAALEALYKQGAYAHLERVIKTLVKAYGRNHEAFDGLMLRGLGLFFRSFGPEVDDERLVMQMGNNGGPVHMLSHARNLAEITGMTVGRAVSERIRAVYNKGLRVHNQLKATT